MNVTCVLIHAAGQNADGTMTEATTRACQIAIGKYHKDHVMTIIITTGIKNAHRRLADEMEDFLRQNGVDGRNIVSLPTAMSQEEELRKCQEWIANVEGLCIEKLDQIFYDRHAAAVLTA